MRSDQFFQELEGTTFRTFAELKAAANAKAVEHLAVFPPRFDMAAYLDWALDKGWIVRVNDGIEVKVHNSAGAD